jgi:hypothetical protein
MLSRHLFGSLEFFPGKLRIKPNVRLKPLGFEVSQLRTIVGNPKNLASRAF